MIWRFTVLILALACSARAQVAMIEVEPRTPAIRDGRLVEAIGIETLGGVFTPLLESGCAIPCETTKTFSTAADGQTEISVPLFRGKAELAAENHSLGRFAVIGIPGRPRGEPKVAITIRAESSGIVLLARELSGASLRIRREP
jgi:molecular chaperone DnaK